MFIALRDYSHNFDGIKFFSHEMDEMFWTMMKKAYNEGRTNDVHLMGCITYRRSLQENATLVDDVAATLQHSIYESLKEEGPENKLFAVTFQKDNPIMEHRNGYSLQAMKAIAPVVISKVEEGSLCALTKDARGNVLYLHSNNFDGYNYEKAVRKALEMHYDRYGEIAEEIPFTQSMSRLVDDVDEDTPLPYQINRIKYMVRDDHLALCVPFNETMVAAAELANCGAFRFDDELMILNIFSPTKTEAKCLYDNLLAFRKFKEEMKKWR